MSSILHQEYIVFSDLTVVRLANLSGILHQNFLLLEKTYRLTIKSIQNKLLITTNFTANIPRVKKILTYLYQWSDEPIPIEMVQAIINDEELKLSISPLKISRKNILPRNSKQLAYINSMDTKDIIFAVGPAGTGKTYLAVSKAIELFEKGEVQRLIFVRPAVEAGEKLGFLPGDLNAKLDPYLRPLYDALFDMIPQEEITKLMESGQIEIAPLAFMRGRTLSNSFIILDEAQNTTPAQMKMFLTRLGMGSKMSITGDMSQIDLPKQQVSGLVDAIRKLGEINSIEVIKFTQKDVVRHPLSAKIINAYEKYDSPDLLESKDSWL